MNFRLKPTLIASSVLLAVMSQQAAATNGYFSHGVGTMQKAMGGAAVAGSDNAMNLATNPAAMSFGENNWTVGLEIFSPDRNATRGATFDAAFPAVTYDGNDDDLFPIPEFGYQRKLSDKYSVGIAVFGNGGMNATYDQPIFGAGPGSSNTGLDLAQLFVTPSVSMKVNENHAIGLSVNLAYQRFKINGVDGFAGISSAPGNLSDLGYSSSTGLGATIGWQGRLTSRLKAGLAYRSKTKMSEFDKYKGLFAEQGDFDMPSVVTAGVSFQATPKTTLAFDYSRINYSDIASVANKNTSATGTQLGNDDGPGFGWDDMNIYKVGVKHQLNEKLTLLGGWNHGKAPISSDETAFNVLAPATVEDHLTLGMDWKLTNKSNVTAYYMHAFNNEIKGNPLVPGSFVPTGLRPDLGQGGTADIEMSQNAVGIAYSRDF